MQQVEPKQEFVAVGNNATRQSFFVPVTWTIECRTQFVGILRDRTQLTLSSVSQVVLSASSSSGKSPAISHSSRLTPVVPVGSKVVLRLLPPGSSVWRVGLPQQDMVTRRWDSEAGCGQLVAELAQG